MKHGSIMLGKMYIYSLVLNKFILNDKLNIKWQILDKVPSIINKGNNKITELRAILQRESQNS